jgi:DNA-binding HxlR family transcriptional regulator
MNSLQLQENLKKYTRIEECPIRNVLSRFSSKWAMLILCVLSENEATRFNIISKAIPDISPKVLTETLKALEADGLVKRKLYAEIPPRVEYSLTEVGQSLIPILNNLITWSLDNAAYISKHRKKSRYGL